MSVEEDWARSSEEMILSAEQLAFLRDFALSEAPKALAALEIADSDNEQFYALPGAAFAAFHLGRFDDAKDYAERALALAVSFQDNWHYGNVKHKSPSILGLLALQKGDVPGAVEALHASGATPGSPQLNSFGPTMQLAIALLEVGERDAVLHYLEQCASFWKMGGSRLAIWRRKIVAGEMPNFVHQRYG